MPNRTSNLIFSNQRTDSTDFTSSKGELLYSSQNGIPLSWIFAFGGRNIWTPGDSVEERGGVVGQRHTYETQVEVALNRLENVQNELSQDTPWLWPWLSPISLLRRKLMTKSPKGFIRIAAPWTTQLKKADQEHFRSAIAYAENAVHSSAQGNHIQSAQRLSKLTPFCPFVPQGKENDQALFEKLPFFQGEELPLRIALINLGEPSNRKPFDQAVSRDVAPAWENYQPLKQPTKIPPPTKKEVQVHGLDKGGILGKIKSLFKR